MISSLFKRIERFPSTSANYGVKSLSIVKGVEFRQKIAPQFNELRSNTVGPSFATFVPRLCLNLSNVGNFLPGGRKLLTGVRPVMTTYLFLFLWRFFLNRFLRLCVAIL